ncbi:hypothetical protein BMW22_30510 (plasmid) [Rhizobium leguminosarum]|uniref:Uncharacterized protein n=1 Tax=Rhizobium leguminosarum TaxID=384 RepID=A0A1L3ZJG3_RHILE|nr:hypothetical protein BMW22_30510 [Rhizobium leguminosarum]
MFGNREPRRLAPPKAKPLLQDADKAVRSRPRKPRHPTQPNLRSEPDVARPLWGETLHGRRLAAYGELARNADLAQLHFGSPPDRTGHFRRGPARRPSPDVQEPPLFVDSHFRVVHLDAVGHKEGLWLDGGGDRLDITSYDLLTDLRLNNNLLIWSLGLSSHDGPIYSASPCRHRRCRCGGIYTLDGG